MWRTAENGSSVKPAELDTTSSNVWNYIRKDFVLVPADDERPEHWQWLENKISKEDWETYQNVMEHGQALDDVYDALTELAEIIVGV